MVIDQVLPDGHGVAPPADGLGDQLAVGLAGARLRRAAGAVGAVSICAEALIQRTVLNYCRPVEPAVLRSSSICPGISAEVSPRLTLLSCSS